MQDLSGTNLKRYELLEQLGAGGFGAVYRARQTTIGREVAVKVILSRLANLESTAELYRIANTLPVSASVYAAFSNSFT